MSCTTGCDIMSPQQQSQTPMCPTRMSDGRAFTDYRPRCVVNAEVNAKMARTSYESRIYLQQHAEEVMEAERQKAIDRLSPCMPCKRSFDDMGTMLPERYVVRCDAATCERIEVNPRGLGDGRS